MRAWILFLPILLFAQSSSPPSQSVPVDNAVSSTKSAKDSTSKKAEAKQHAPSTIAPPAQPSSKRSQQATDASPPQKPLEVTPDSIVRYTFWLVIVGGLQFLALIVQAVFLWKAFRETTTATNLTAAALVEARRSNAANEALTLESNATARISADAATASVDMLITKERARLVLAPNLRMQDQATAMFVVVFVINRGITTAFDIESRIACYAWDRNTTPPTDSAMPPYFLEEVKGEKTGMINIEVVPPLSDGDAEAIVSGEKTLRFQAKTRFTDVFGKRRTLISTLRLFVSGPANFRDYQWVLTDDPQDNTETEEGN